MIFETKWRKQKSDARKAATTLLHEQPSKCALFLPGRELCCCLEAMEQGTIDLETKMVIVERDKESMKRIKRKYSSLSRNKKLPVSVRFIQNELTTINQLPKLDYAFVDWYNEFSYPAVRFLMTSFKKTIIDGADVSLTFCLNNRKNPYSEGIKQFLDGYEEIKIETYKKWNWIPNYKIEYMLSSLRLIFDDFDFDIYHDPFKYHDTSKIMVYIRLSNLRKTNSVFNRHVMSEFNLYVRNERLGVVCSQNHSMKGQKMNGKSIAQEIVDAEASGSAGKKAAATRRRRQYVAQRAAAGKDPVMVDAGIKAAISRMKSKD